MIGPSRQKTDEGIRGKVKSHEDMLSRRRIMDIRMQNLYSELKDQACALAALKGNDVMTKRSFQIFWMSKNIYRRSRMLKLRMI
ncbi:unnamed protein product [Albugo candida]|uniref:Uncharacterized protein n=1 Tax=Albugo candida TaxID=65357 RepID=A0A024FV89_9STRA|nr:unnamed protein product [Albugo candida]|eukprot:CCI10564.1 unnamed protein product [Albugo candida]